MSVATITATLEVQNLGLATVDCEIEEIMNGEDPASLILEENRLRQIIVASACASDPTLRPSVKAQREPIPDERLMLLMLRTNRFKVRSAILRQH